MAGTFVLIIGAWHGGWAWNPVAKHLRAGGHRVFTPTMPGLAYGDDPRKYELSDVVDFVVEFVESRGLSEVTLVGHSWGGFPITGAARRLAPHLKKLIYWSAFVPAEGRSVLDEVPPSYRELFTALAAASGNNSIPLPWEIWANAFIQDAPEPVQRVLHDLLVPQPMQYLDEPIAPLDLPALGVPASYVLTTEDISLPPGEYAWAPRFPDRLGVASIETPGSHEACVTQPARLAEALLKA